MTAEKRESKLSDGHSTAKRVLVCRTGWDSGTGRSSHPGKSAAAAACAVIAITAPDRPATARSVARVTACALWGLETALVKIGRASCRERGQASARAGAGRERA